MKKIFLLILVSLCFTSLFASSPDTAVISKIRNESIANTNAMNNLKTFCYYSLLIDCSNWV